MADRTGRDKPLSQSDFAVILGVRRSVVQAWERGVKSPSGSARRLMEILDLFPHVGKSLVASRGTWRRRFEEEASGRGDRL